MLNTVFNEDCLIGMQRIPDKSIDMILCDLPYGTTACKWDVIIPFEPLWKQYERVIKDNGAIVLTASQPFTTLLIAHKINLFKYCWTWDKVVCSSPMIAKYQPLRTTEDICVFYKGKCIYNPIIEEKPKSHIRGNNIQINHKSEVYNTLKSYGRNERREIPVDKMYPKNIIRISNNCRYNGSTHPTQKPVALFEYLIKTYTNEGETVLDNCMGSGTTAIACINTNRNYIGFEKEEKYFNIIQDRIKKHTPQLKLIPC